MKTDASEDHVFIRTSKGTIKVDRSAVVHFPDGILGFEDYTDFVILDINNCAPFKSMLSVAAGGPDFVVIEPMLVFDDYAPIVSNLPAVEEDIGGGDDRILLSIVTLSEKPEQVTVNLRGPILLNLKTRRARQIILDDDRCRTKVPLLVRE